MFWDMKIKVGKSKFCEPKDPRVPVFFQKKFEENFFPKKICEPKDPGVPVFFQKKFEENFFPKKICEPDFSIY